MGLKDLSISTSYETGESKTQLLDEFYNPVLEQATKYYRIAGFFSSSALVVAAKEAAKSAGAECIFLEVRQSNIPAISLYKKEGFEELGIRKKFYEHPVEDAIIMKVGI